MMDAHICLVSSAHPSMNPRLVKEADALVTAGHRVTVIACRSSSTAERLDAEYDSRAWALAKVPFGPEARRLTYLRQTLWRQTAGLVFKFTGMFAESALHPVSGDLARAAEAVQADLYIAHNLPALPAAYRAARRHHGRLGFDAEDFHRGELPQTTANVSTLELIRKIEETYLPRCDFVTAASPGIARAYTRACGIPPPPVILNVFSRSDAPVAPKAGGAITEAPSLYWFSQTLGPDRGLQTVIEAMALTKSRPTLHLRGRPVPGTVELLTDLARRHGVANRLAFLPVASPAQMIALAAKYDMGLACEIDGTANRNICLTNKIFTYLSAGVPVLASATEAQSELATRLPGVIHLYAQGDAGALALHIDRLCHTSGALRLAKQTAWQAGQQTFCWERESEHFLNTVESCLGNSLPPGAALHPASV